MSAFVLLALTAVSSLVTALYLNCPTLESFLTLVTNTPALEDKTVRDIIPIQQQLVNALLRARVITLSRQHSFLEVWRHIHILDITFYGLWGKWYVWGQYHPVMNGLRDGAPLLDHTFQDATTARHMAQEWQTAERALVRGESQGPLEVFQRIAERLCHVKSSVANIDAALALLMAWQAAENARQHDQAITCLTNLVKLVEHSIHYAPVVRWVQMTVADILYKKGHEHAIELYKQVIRDRGYDDTYYHSIGQMACFHFHKQEYQTVIAHTTHALRYYRNQIDVNTAFVGQLVLAKCQSQMALLQYTAWVRDRSLVQFFSTADGGTSQELVFVGRLCDAWVRRDRRQFSMAVREYDRHSPMTDEQIRIFSETKRRIAST